MTTNQLSVFPTEPILDVSPVLETTPADKSGLPTDWQWVKLGDVVNKIFDGPFGSNLKTVDYIDEPGYQVIRLENIGYMEFIGHKVTFISEQKFAFLEKHEIYEGDIVFSSFIGVVVRTTVVPKLKYRAINKADCFCIRISPDKVDRHFIVYALSRQETQKVISLGVHGATRPRINTTFLKSFKLPLPPLAEQHRIVAKIEELFTEIDAGIKEVETALLQLKTYRQAVLDEFIDDDSLDTTRLGDIANIRGGVTKGRNLDGLATISLPYLRVANVQDGFLNLREIKYIDVLETDLEKYRLVENDILFTEGGDKDKLGRGTIWRDEIANCIHQNHIFRARVDQHFVNPIYVTYASKTTKAKRYFYKVAKQTTNLASINMSQLCNLEIPLPDLATQTQIVQEIEARLSEADALEKTLRTELLRAERLRQSVLKQAFTGKLLKTDVPASLLA